MYNNLYSFDGERKGFILGGGIGAGYLSNSTSYNSFSHTDNRAVFLTNFKIGYAPSNTLEIYCLSKVAWREESNKPNILGLLAVAARVYLNNETETGWSISGGFGYSGISEPFESPLESRNGFGFFLGGGYEFISHWNVELDLLYSKITERTKMNSFGLLLTVNVLAF